MDLSPSGEIKGDVPKPSIIVIAVRHPLMIMSIEAIKKPLQKLLIGVHSYGFWPDGGAAFGYLVAELRELFLNSLRHNLSESVPLLDRMLHALPNFKRSNDLEPAVRELIV